MTQTTTKKPSPDRSATPSTPRLSEVARHLVIPDGITTSVFPRVEARLKTVGVEFDLWQQGLGAVALGCRADGRYAATIGGVVASIPRQVGKTYTVGNLLIGAAAEFPGLRVIWTSHHARTTTNTFRAMAAMVKRSQMRHLLAPNGIRQANGEQEIRFANGSIIMFGAREHGFGRGMDAIDFLVFDEAQILSLKALEDMVPATNQAKHPHGALVFFIGTPPRPGDDGEAFRAKRAAAVAGKTTDQVYVEFSADPGASLDDRAQWPKMNPSHPKRTPLESMLRMRENIPDDDAWRREAMGVWDEIGGAPWDLWPQPEWEDRAEEPQGAERWLNGPVTLAVEVSLDRSTATVCVAGERTENVVGVGVVARGHGTGWVADHLAELLADHDRPVARVVLDPRSPAGALIDDLTLAGIELTLVDGPQLAKATGDFHDAVMDDEIVHRNEPELTEAVAHARWRTYGDARLIDRRTGVDVAPIIGCILARAGHLMGAPEGDVDLASQVW